MELSDIQSVLGFLTGSMQPGHSQTADSLLQAQSRMGKVLLNNKELDLPIFKTIPAKELFQSSSEHLQKIQKLTSTLKPVTETEDEELFFIRNASSIHPFIGDTQPNWARGSLPTQSLGPFIDGDGQTIYIDFYKIAKLITLYVGNTPVLSFSISTSLLGVIGNPRLGTEITLRKGSLWVNAKLLNGSANETQFAGFEIESGKLNLSNAPTIINSKNSIAATTTIKLSFKLSNTTTNYPKAKFALDSDTVNLDFPIDLELRGSAQSLNFSALNKGICKAYDFASSFEVATQTNLKYNAVDKVLYTDLSFSNPAISIISNDKKYFNLEGNADVTKLEWLFPLSTININQIPVANNIFFIKASVSKGISFQWKHLKYQPFLFQQAELIIRKENILWRDTAAYAQEGATHLDLWKHLSSHSKSSIDISYSQKQPLIFLSDRSQDLEQLSTLGNIKSQFDRPISVRNTAFNINSKHSNVFFIQKAEGILIGIIDINLLEDDPIQGNRIEAIALYNALFRVSNISQCVWYGNLDEDSDQVKRINAFLFYKLHMYQPTLPDPYIGDFRTWERLSFGLREKPLIYHIQLNNGAEENEDLRTKFYFGTLPTAEDLIFKEDTPANKEKDTPAIKDKETPTPTNPTFLGNITLPKKIILTDIIKRDTSILQPILTKKINDISIISDNKIKPVLSQKIESLISVSKLWKDIIEIKPKEDDSSQLNLVNPSNLSNESRSLEKTLQYESVYNNSVIGYRLENEFFALLDISSNVNQMGVSLSGQQMFIPTNRVKENSKGEYGVIQANELEFKVEGMEVMFENDRIRNFMLPQHAWEPVMNLSSVNPVKEMDPLKGLHFFANNGGASRITNNSKKFIPLTPLATIDAIISDFKSNTTNYTLAAFTLPFGMKAVSVLNHKGNETIKPTIENIRPKFRKQPDGSFLFEGGHQISLKAGNHARNRKSPGIPEDSNMFPGFTVQLNNYTNEMGLPSGKSHLGDTVTKTFNLEFFQSFLSNPDLKLSRGVPVTRVDLTGYGTNMFSNWVSAAAALNEVSQAKFDTFHGRTAHEVIQIKSMIYPWGIRVVRTITTYRGKNGRIFREDSGWQCESDGMFNFRVKGITTDPFQFHPGMMHGIINIQNIRETLDIQPFQLGNVKLDPVYFDGDILLENISKGGDNNKVPSKKILGYLHNLPQGVLITPEDLAQLIQSQPLLSIGGVLDCEMNLNQSEQLLRAHRFDMNVARDTNGFPSFVGSIRGNIILPNDGSWTVVEHSASTGEVYPVNQDQGVSFVRKGVWEGGKMSSTVDLAKELIKMSPPEQLLLHYTSFTKNFGLLQNTNTQKVLFLSPVYENSRKAILSRIPPLFADAHRLMKSSGIFTNIGDAITNYGAALLLDKGRNEANQLINAFKELSVEDAGKKVFEVMFIEVKKEGEKIIEKGVRLAKNEVNNVLDKAFKFDIPEGTFYIVEEEMFKLYVEYVAPESNPVDYDKYYGKTVLDYDFNSLKNDFADQWKSRLSNIALVVDLGPIERLVTVKANFNSQKGEKTNFGGTKNSVGLPTPEIKFSDELKPVMEILDVLAKLSGGQYDDVIKNGLKVAMSNSGEIWSYKYEIDKSIPLIRFPAQDELYNNATTPLKLECGLTLGAYFNAALKLTNDLNQLVPTAGAYLGFTGGIEVLCTSVGAGSLYAIGKVGLKISAETSGKVELFMTFGFGVKLAVSLPVVGHASVSFMVGVELTINNEGVECIAIMVFRGNASLLGGIVAVTIMIEAKGGVKKIGNKTECKAQVTFALDISIFLIIDISFSKTWGEDRQIA